MSVPDMALFPNKLNYGTDNTYVNLTIKDYSISFNIISSTEITERECMSPHPLNKILYNHLIIKLLYYSDYKVEY